MDLQKLAANADLASSSSRKVKIGVLGGIGPEATSQFYSRLIKKLQKRNLIRRNTDYPQIIINSIPAPELVLEKINEMDLEPYMNGIQFLDKSGVDFIVMVCNTIHIYYDLLQSSINTLILDLREEVRKVLEKQNKRVLILGTPGTINSGIYEFDGIEYQKLTKTEMSAISDSILLFNKGDGSKAPAQICRKYSRNNKIMLACTELSLMLEKEGISNISTLDILVDATINKFLSLMLKQEKIKKRDFLFGIS